MSSLLRRVLRIEPSISLGQWAYDRAANNWQAIILFFGGGGGLTYLAVITEWTSAWGPIVGRCLLCGRLLGAGALVGARRDQSAQF